jgi:hypothetical protein
MALFAAHEWNIDIGVGGDKWKVTLIPERQAEAHSRCCTTKETTRRELWVFTWTLECISRNVTLVFGGGAPIWVGHMHDKHMASWANLTLQKLVGRSYVIGVEAKDGTMVTTRVPPRLFNNLVNDMADKDKLVRSHACCKDQNPRCVSGLHLD